MHHNNIHIKSHWIDAERAQTDIFEPLHRLLLRQADLLSVDRYNHQ